MPRRPRQILVLDEKTEIPPGDSRRNFFLAMNSRKSSPPQDDVRFAQEILQKCRVAPGKSLSSMKKQRFRRVILGGISF